MNQKIVVMVAVVVVVVVVIVIVIIVPEEISNPCKTTASTKSDSSKSNQKRD